MNTRTGEGVGEARGREEEKRHPDTSPPSEQSWDESESL
jgi:hypothetical protein